MIFFYRLFWSTHIGLDQQRVLFSVIIQEISHYIQYCSYSLKNQVLSVRDMDYNCYNIRNKWGELNPCYDIIFGRLLCMYWQPKYFIESINNDIPWHARICSLQEIVNSLEHYKVESDVIECEFKRFKQIEKDYINNIRFISHSKKIMKKILVRKVLMTLCERERLTDWPFPFTKQY